MQQNKNTLFFRYFLEETRLASIGQQPLHVLERDNELAALAPTGSPRVDAEEQPLLEAHPIDQPRVTTHPVAGRGDCAVG